MPSTPSMVALGDLIRHTTWPSPDHRPWCPPQQVPPIGQGWVMFRKDGLRASWTPGVSQQGPTQNRPWPNWAVPAAAGHHPQARQDTLSLPHGPQEGHSPHRAQAAAIQLELAEVGQVQPCGPQGEVRGCPPACSPAHTLHRHQRPSALLPAGCSEAQWHQVYLRPGSNEAGRAGCGRCS